MTFDLFLRGHAELTVVIAAQPWFRRRLWPGLARQEVLAAVRMVAR